MYVGDNKKFGYCFCSYSQFMFYFHCYWIANFTGFFPHWVPQFFVDSFAALGFLTHYDSVSKGVLDIRDILFFGVFIFAWLFASGVVIEIKKAN